MILKHSLFQLFSMFFAPISVYKIIRKKQYDEKKTLLVFVPYFTCMIKDIRIH